MRLSHFAQRHFVILAALALGAPATHGLFAQNSGTATRAGADSAKRSAGSIDSTDDADDTSNDRPPRIAYGVTGRSSTFQDGHAEYGTGVVLAFAPAPWASLALNPSYAVATNPKRTTTAGHFNLSSVPVELNGSHEFAAPMHPELGLSLGAEFPVNQGGDTASTSHQPNYSAGIGLGITPVQHLNLSADASRDLGGSSEQSLLAQNAMTSVGAAMSVDAGDRLTIGASFSGDVGTVTAGDTLTRSVGGNLALKLAGPLTLTLDGSHRLAGNTPQWGMSVGIGTAFAGVATVGPASALSRLRHAGRALHSKGNGK